MSRSQSTIANFPKRLLLKISQKSALPYELVGWNWHIEVGKFFLRNCKPKFLRKFWLNCFNQYLHRHFVTSAEHLLPGFCVWHFGLENLCHYYVKIFIFEWVVFKHRFVFFKKNFYMSSIIVSTSIFSSAIDLSMVLALELILAEKTACPTQPKRGSFQVSYSKNCSVFPENQWRYFIQRGIIGY